MSGDAPVRRLALLLEYEGTGLGGSQYQTNTGTIQDALERALRSLTGEPIRVALAGRTDAGVHARGQVAACTSGSRHGPDVFVRALNHHLPDQIAVRAAREVPLTFDPRRQAAGRRYRYTIHNGRQRPALLRRFVWQVAEPLDVDAMRQAAVSLVGQHDFVAFTQPSLAGRQSTCRRMTRAEVKRSGRRIRVDMEANAFLPHQVRRTVGSLVEVGRGRLSPAEFEALVREARPGAASFAAPARGLCLMKVRYEDGLFDDETDEDL
ncbi:MAG: tRNA pseudouridine(38-40) synthase TruA [Chloroflexi bacterium]|nr:tRNA pseudouridine(38-40) synthase TruA [Chloroflexota bacterium]